MMDIKLQKEQKFKIGEQYAKHEFELDWVKSVLDGNLRYEVYQYIGKDKITIFGFLVQKVLLAYNCDFLAGIFCFLANDSCSKINSEMLTKFHYTRRIKINVVKKCEKITQLFVTNERISNYPLFI